MSIKAIQTQYKGYHFRSRLEARWAVFFDACGYQWEYEPEGFDLGDGVYYLPDFKLHLPCGGVQWCEVKPIGVCPDVKFGKFKELLVRCDATPVVLIGDPHHYLHEAVLDEDRSYGGLICYGCGSVIESEHWGLNTDKILAWVCKCCYGKRYENESWHSPLFGKDYKLIINKSFSIFYPYGKTELLEDGVGCPARDAMRVARSARFEHGESGATL